MRHVSCVRISTVLLSEFIEIVGNRDILDPLYASGKTTQKKGYGLRLDDRRVSTLYYLFTFTSFLCSIVKKNYENNIYQISLEIACSFQWNNMAISMLNFLSILLHIYYNIL